LKVIQVLTRLPKFSNAKSANLRPPTIML
jgi:hypothetical protein